MASKTNTQDGGGVTDEGRKRKGRQTKSASNSRNNSRTNSPSKTAKQNVVDSNLSEEIWNCELCKRAFSNPDDKLLECQRCNEHFCIKCLDKSVEEYTLLSSTDIMWFCPPCREKVEKNIITDREIEARCRDLMDHFENRIHQLGCIVHFTLQLC